MHRHTPSLRTFVIGLLSIFLFSTFSVCENRTFIRPLFKLKKQEIKSNPSESQLINLIEKIKSIEGARVKNFECEIYLPQPLDHQKPEGEKFFQRIFLSHVDVSKPVVFITEGYSAERNYIKELGTILKANQIRVEHRFFGESKPNSMEWKYLTIKQAAADHHRIVNLFKEIYKVTWVSAGWSKGGQTALIHRCYYPDDIDVTVAYDAPINFALEEPRIDKFFETVGSEYCRNKLIRFQRMILKRKKQVLPLFIKYSNDKGYKYSIGEERALEYIVLEYPFSFWQYHKIDCRSIPDEGASIEDMFEHLKKVVTFSSYSDLALNSPSMYQFSTELGYYGYVTSNVKDLLSSEKYKNTVFAPQNIPLIYKPDLMQNVNDWLQNNGNNIIYIYGELDPWSAPAVEVTGKTNALKIFLKGGNHFTFINSFPEKKREIIYSTLEKWLDIAIER